jgi:hypothetical protein
MLMVIIAFICFRDRGCLSFTWQTYNRNPFHQHTTQKFFLQIVYNGKICSSMDGWMWLFVVVGVCEWMGPPMGGPIPFHPHPLIHPTTNPIIGPKRSNRKSPTPNDSPTPNRWLNLPFNLSENTQRVFVRFNEPKTPR